MEQPKGDPAWDCNDGAEIVSTLAERENGHVKIVMMLDALQCNTGQLHHMQVRKQVRFGSIPSACKQNSSIQLR